MCRNVLGAKPENLVLRKNLWCANASLTRFKNACHAGKGMVSNPFRFLLFAGSGVTVLWVFFSGLLHHSLLLLTTVSVLFLSKELA